MRIYLEMSALQRLKELEYAHLLPHFLALKEHNPIFFSEAHHYDLMRSIEEYRLLDFNFMESVMASNCLYYQGGFKFTWRTPTEFYEDFDWPESEEISEADLAETQEKATRWVYNIIQKAKLEMKVGEQLPEDMPESFKVLILTSNDLDSFRANFPTFINAMTTDDKEHKKLLQFLHKSVSSARVMAEIGIEGHDGSNITDRSKFVQSFAGYYKNGGQDETDYDLFTAMYHGLELMAFVKGDTSKQRAIPMLNDSRHAFFGTRCDVVISNDKDFVRKTRFIYDLLDLNIQVIPLNEVEQALMDWNAAAKMPVLSVFSEMETNRDIVQIVERDKVRMVCTRLKQEYVGYFDMMVDITEPKGKFSYLRKEIRGIAPHVIPQEVIYVTDRLIMELGLDKDKLGSFSSDKPVEREWIFGNNHMHLRIVGETIVLYFFQDSGYSLHSAVAYRKPHRLKRRRHFNGSCNRLFTKR